MEWIYLPIYIFIVHKFIYIIIIRRMSIPRIIHFIWMDFTNILNPNPNIPEKYRENVENVKRLNPTFKIKIWNGYECDQFIQKYFPSYYQRYIDLPYPIQKCDYIRFFILFHYGGIYSDFDRISIRSYENLLKSNEKEYDVLLGEISLYGLLNNDIMISKKGDLFIKRCMDEMKIQEVGNFFLDVTFTTGPLYITKIYHQMGRPKNIKILKNEINPTNFCNDLPLSNFQESYSFTTLDNSWLEGKKNIFFRLGKCMVCNIKQIMIVLILFIFFYIFVCRRYKIKHRTT